MNTAQRIYYTGQAIGWGNLPRRVWQTLRGRLGITRRRLPAGELSPAAMRAQFAADYDPAQAVERWRSRADRFLFSPQDKPALRDAVRSVTTPEAWDRRVVQVCRGLRDGKMPFFSHRIADTGWPPRFNHDPVNDVEWPVGRHWSTYTQFDPALADIKCIWEASRFTNAFHLARWYLLDGCAQAAETFWEMFEAWDRQDPYGLTPQSTCGQESSFRMFAWLLAALAMLDHSATTPKRLHRLTERIWYTARHVEGNINYARGQKNNHAISEAVGLWTVGLLFPELRRSAHWRRLGRNVLIAELRRQIYPDGSYVQHSLNYHRLMLDDLLWGIRLGEVNHEPLPEPAVERVRAAMRWLIEMIEPVTGAVPNYGANDGALVLSLSTCDYTDYRPTAQAASLLLDGERCLPSGPWDEQAVWLMGATALRSAITPVTRGVRRRFDDGGYYVFRGPSSWALTRCHSYHDRPVQADMLHFDLWYDHVNVLRDGGTYSYYCEAPWQSYFKSTAAHNTVEVDGQDQMIPGPRFLWLRWPRSRLIRFESSADGRVTVFQGEHYGYQRLPGRVVHRRTICRIEDTYVIVDDVLGSGRHELALRWRLCSGGWALDDARCAAEIAGGPVTIDVAASGDHAAKLLEGCAQPQPEGWESRYYSEMTAVPTLRATTSGMLPLRFASIIQRASHLSLASPPTVSEPVSVNGVRDASISASAERLSGGLLRCIV